MCGQLQHDDTSRLLMIRAASLAPSSATEPKVVSSTQGMSDKSCRDTDSLTPRLNPLRSTFIAAILDRPPLGRIYLSYEIYGHLPRLSISECAKKESLGIEHEQPEPQPWPVTSTSTSADVERNQLTSRCSAHSRLCIPATAEMPKHTSAAKDT